MSKNYIVFDSMMVPPQKNIFLLLYCIIFDNKFLLILRNSKLLSINFLCVTLSHMSIIDRNLPRLDTSYVIGDNKTGGALCLRHLHALGHQRICFVSSARRNTFTVRSRIDGILQEAKARNIPESSITILDFFNKHQPYVHYQKQMMKLIREERITAFIAAESTTCAYLYSLFATMNLRVPEDISLMSFDKPLVESQHPDFFTHISQSEYLMGKEAGTILKHQIETRDPQVTHRVMSPLLEVRKSTRAIVL